MVTSHFRLEVEVWPFCACTVKNMQYNLYYRNSSVVVDLLLGRFHISQNVFLVSSIFKLQFACYACISFGEMI